MEYFDKVSLREIKHLSNAKLNVSKHNSTKKVSRNMIFSSQNLQTCNKHLRIFFLLTASCHHHWKLGDVTSGIFSISDWLIYTSKIQISFLWNARVNWWANRRRERWSILILEIIKHKNVAQWTTLFLQASSPIVIHYCFLFFMLLRFAIPESSDVTT